MSEMSMPGQAPTGRPEGLLYLAVDFSNLIYRNHHALAAQKREFNSPDGQPTGALMLTLSKIDAARKLLNPDVICAVFEGGGKGARQAIHEGYKSERPPAPDAVRSQTRLAFQLMPLLGINCIREPGKEADDTLISLAVNAKSLRARMVMLSGDKDMYQAVGDGVSILAPDFKGLDLCGPNECMAKFGVRPDQIPDFLALMGDSVDGIPGVEGIGIKTAAALLQAHQSVEGILLALPTLSKGVAKKIEAAGDILLISKRLASPLPGELEIPWTAMDAQPQWSVAADKLEVLGFKTFVKTLRARAKKEQGSAGVASPAATSVAPEAAPASEPDSVAVGEQRGFKF